MAMPRVSGFDEFNQALTGIVMPPNTVGRPWQLILVSPSRASSPVWGDLISALSGLDFGWSASARPTRGAGASLPGTGPMSPAPMMSEQPTGGYATNQGGTVVASISSAEESPARTGPSPGSEPASKATEAASSSTGQTESQTSLFGPDGSSSRTCQGFSPLPTEGTLPSFSARWPTSGMASAGGYWTLDTSECPSGAVECSLSAILEPTAAPRYALSARAAAGILRRASARGRLLPAELEAALRAVAG